MANTAIVYLTAPSFDKLDKAMTTELALLIYCIAFGVAVVSLAAAVCSMEPGYRHTFVGSKTGRKYWVSDWIGLAAFATIARYIIAHCRAIPNHTHHTALQPPHSVSASSG